MLESAVAQPRATFGGREPHGSLLDKAAGLAFSLVRSHAFIDGNKRVSHAAMEVFLYLNGHEVSCAIEEQEAFWLGLVSGAHSKDDLRRWLAGHVRALGSDPE